MRTENMTENEPQIYAELDESKAKIESLETAVKDLQIAFRKILEFMEAYNEKDA